MSAQAGAARPFSIRDCDIYLDHLGQLGAQHHPAIATEDLLDEHGTLLLRARSPLGPGAVERLRGARLQAPLDQLLELRSRLSIEELAACFGDMIEDEPDLRRIDRQLGSEGRVRHLCYTLDWSPALLQKLTVLQLALPKVFHRALFTAWFGALVSAERKLDATEAGLLFQAGLWHDLGLLHIPQALVDKKADISAADWATIRGHVELGAAIVEQSTKAPPRLLRVLREHHERHDGAGYPDGRGGADLDTLSPILALADMLHALRFQNLVLSGNSLADCMPYLRVNRRAFGTENYAPVARILHAARDPAAARLPLDAQAVPVLLEANHSLRALLAEFAGARVLLETLPDSRLARSLASLVGEVQWVALSSGLGNETLEQWLGESLENQRDDAGIADIQATAQEVLWLVRRFDRQLKELLPALAGHAHEAALRELSRRVEAELERAWRRFGDG